MDKYLIYALVDPRTGEIRYIGRSSKGLLRARNHWATASELQKSTYCANWIKSLVILGLIPTVFVLESWEKISNARLNKAERKWIRRYKKKNARLTNLTDGGEGNLGCQVSLETRAKMSRAQKRRPDKEDVKRLLLAQAKSSWTKEHRKNLSRSLKGRIYSSETIEKMRSAKRKKTPVRRNDGVLYPSVCAASRALGVHSKRIFEVLSGKCKSVKGFTFQRR